MGTSGFEPRVPNEDSTLLPNGLLWSNNWFQFFINRTLSSTKLQHSWNFFRNTQPALIHGSVAGSSFESEDSGISSYPRVY